MDINKLKEDLRYIDEQAKSDPTIDAEGTKRDYVSQMAKDIPPEAQADPEISPFLLSDRGELTIGERAAGSFSGPNKKQFAQHLRDKGLNISYDEEQDAVYINGKPIDPSGFNLKTKEGIMEAAKDIADITGKSLPTIGAILGGFAGIPIAAAAAIPTGGVGALAVEGVTSGAGAGAGKLVADIAGQKMGVQEEKPLEENLKTAGEEAAATGAYAFAGGAIGRKIGQGIKLVWDQGVPSLLKTFQGLPTEWGKKYVGNPGKYTPDKIMGDDAMIGMSQKAMHALDDYRDVVKKKIQDMFENVRFEAAGEELAKPKKVMKAAAEVFKDSKNRIMMKATNPEFASGIKQMVKEIEDMPMGTMKRIEEFLEKLNHNRDAWSKLQGVTDNDLRLVDAIGGRVRGFLEQFKPYKAAQQARAVMEKELDLAGKVLENGDVMKNMGRTYNESPWVMKTLKKVDDNAGKAYKFLNKMEESMISKSMNRLIPEQVPFTGLLYGVAGALTSWGARGAKGAEILPEIMAGAATISPKLSKAWIRGGDAVGRGTAKMAPALRAAAGSASYKGQQQLEKIFGRDD
jgi:hypothetical protein